MELLNLKQTLMNRDELDEAEANDVIEELYEALDDALENGDDLDEVIMDIVGLEPDYLDEYFVSRF